MRMLLTVVIDTEAGNEAISKGVDYISPMLEALKPEAAYFVTQDGQRTCLVVFDLEDSSQLPGVCEPMFQGVKAKIALTPCMNLEDLQRGLSEATRQSPPQS